MIHSWLTSAKTKKVISKPTLDDLFSFQLKAAGINNFIREYKFHPIRRWKFDFADPETMIAIECEGATFANGRHTRGSGFQKDCEKYNSATILGWRVLRYTRLLIESGQALKDVESLILFKDV